ncbi:hypothetical protein BHE74_00032963 [Ensete ventricosum]|nr:hypothetical protein BHE74_00032963 [Ensete ventricosum]
MSNKRVIGSAFRPCPRPTQRCYRRPATTPPSSTCSTSTSSYPKPPSTTTHSSLPSSSSLSVADACPVLRLELPYPCVPRFGLPPIRLFLKPIAELPCCDSVKWLMRSP